MANQPPHKSSSKDESDDVTAARQELQVLETLGRAVSALIGSFSKKPLSLGKLNHVELALIDQKHGQLKAYEELAHHCYGRTVIGIEVDEKNQPKRTFTYRITQANVGFVESNCFVLARNSRLATELVTALPSDEREVVTPAGERYLNVKEVRTFDGPVSLRSPSEKPNFRSMAIRKQSSKKPIVVEDLRATLRRLDFPELHDEAPPKQEIETQSFDDVDPTWLSSWSGVYLSDTDEQSLGHQFITRTTVDQERALNNPRGVTFVEGIAGAGKTSVALGRLKFFANFGTGAEREYYGLQGAAENDFSPIGMTGFVLSHSLKQYLSETASALELGHLPIRDFEEFRTNLADRFGIASQFRKKRGESSSFRSRINWLRALDLAMAQIAGVRLRENLARAKDIPKNVTEGISRFSSELLHAERLSQPGPFNLSGLAARVVGLIAEGEIREQEDRAREKFYIREEVDSERRRREELNLEREMRRIQLQAEKKIVSPLARSLLSGLTSHELFSAAVALERFPSLVHGSFGCLADSAMARYLDDAVHEIRNLLNQPGGRPALTEADLVTLVIFAAMVAEEFDYVDQSSTLTHLYQIRKNTAVFIDEVQDFTEIEIVLMGMSAKGNYNQITLSGDRCQQLQSTGAKAIEGLFPWVPRSAHNKTIFLDHNFRQRSELAAFSSKFRSLILEDIRIDAQAEDINAPVAIYRYSEHDHFAEFVLQRICSLPRHATIAIITPTVAQAQVWFDLLDLSP